MVKQSPALARNGGTAKAQDLKVVGNTLMVYRTGVTKGESGDNRLAWVSEVRDGHAVREQVIVDAQTGKVLNRWSMLDNALDRRLYETSYNPASPATNLRYTEGDPIPGTLNPDQADEVVTSGESYWFFQDVFDRDSYDGNGATRITVNNDPTIACPNANWNGITTNYCTGVSSDDVVAHEWGHAYTEYTSGLIYQWQSGALNESYSDVWGETLDLINNRDDEGEGDVTSKRADGLCSLYTRGAVQLEVPAPSVSARPLRRRSARPSPRPGSATTSSWRRTRPTRPACRRPTVARRSPTRLPSTASSPTSTVGRARSRSRPTTRWPQAQPGSSSAPTRRQRSSRCRVCPPFPG